MKNKSILDRIQPTVTLILCCLFMTSKGCEGRYQLEYSKCIFNLNYLDDSCKNATFINCSYYHCSPDENNDLTCSNATSSNWVECASECCDSRSLSLSNLTSMSECKNHNDNKTKVKREQGYIILIICLGTLGTLFVTIICLYCLICSDCWKRTICFNFWKQTKATQTPFVQTAKYKETKDNNNFFQNMHEWKRQEHSLSHKDGTCEICHQRKCTWKLSCGHFHHEECILWEQNECRKCPSCKNNSSSQVRIYCLSCYDSYYIYSIENVDNNQLNYCLNCNLHL